MLTISNYHYIRESFESEYPSIFGVKPDEFLSQLKLLKTTGEFVSPNDIISNHEAIFNSKENYILISFDDGLKEQFNIAKPILDSLKISALFFVNTANFFENKISLVHKIHYMRSKIAPSSLISMIENIDKNNVLEFNDEDINKAISHYKYDTQDNAILKYFLNFKIPFSKQEKIVNQIFNNSFSEEALDNLYMTKSELQELSKNHVIGSHSHNHIPLGLFTDNEIESELTKSKIGIENLLNKKVDFLSYPYGNKEACTNNVFSIAKKLNYQYAFTMERGVNKENKNPLALKRFACNDLIGGKNYKA